MTPLSGTPVAHEVMVPVSVPHEVSGVHEGNLKEAMRVDQLKAPLVLRYSFVYQNVHWSTGSMVMDE